MQRNKTERETLNMSNSNEENQETLLPEHSSSAEVSSEASSWELALGMKWFSRVGIVALLIGFVMALKYSFDLLELDPQVIALIKVLIGFASAGGLFTAGQFLIKKFLDSGKFNILGRVLQSGGLVLGYLSLYGMFFIPEVQLVHKHSLAIGWPLLIGYVGMMILLSRRFESRTMGLLALAFGYYTASFSGSQIQAFATAAILAVASVMLSSYKANWRIISLAGMVGTLLTFIYWNLLAPSSGAFISPFGIYQEQQAFLWFHFIVFHLGNIFPSKHASGLLNILNSFVFYTLFHLLTQHDWPAGLFEASLAVCHLASYGYAFLQKGNLKETLKDSIFTQGNLVLALSFSALATLHYCGADSQALVLASEALCLAFISSKDLSRHGRIYQYSAYGFWIAAYASLFIINWATMATWPLVLTVGAVSLVGLVLEHILISRRVNPQDILIARFPIMATCSMTFLIALLSVVEVQYLTLSLLGTTALFMSAGFLVTKAKKYRWNGLLWMLLALGHLVIIDIPTLETIYKIYAFLALGVVMLGGSFAYHMLNGKMVKVIGSENNISETSDDTSNLNEGIQ